MYVSTPRRAPREGPGQYIRRAEPDVMDLRPQILQIKARGSGCLRTHRVDLGILVCALVLAAPMQAVAQVAESIVPTGAPGYNEEEAEAAETETLQQRLTEREDRRRPPDPFSLDVGGRPLTLGGEYEIKTDYRRDERWGLEQELEVEAFYSFGTPLSLFAQLRLGRNDHLLSSIADETSGNHLERGEMWLYSVDVAGTGLNLDLGRLHFEDDRRWWWDEDLDAVRITREGNDYEIALALAQELAPSRSDRSYIEPEHDQVRRLIAEVSWDWGPDHGLQLFALHQDDRSAPGAPGERLRSEREDTSDARLTWVGARLGGGFELERGGILGYWADWAQVRGHERLIAYETLNAKDSEVVAVTQREVHGQGYDVGLNWLLPLAVEPRLFAGLARGSGDADGEDSVDRAFRQTGLQGNEGGFGGVERFASYGFLLDPELSNLRIETLGAGISLLRTSSLDLVAHRYRLDRPATELRGAAVDLALDGMHRDLGSGLDLALALEEWERFEFGFIASALRTGRAFEISHGPWRYAALLTVRIVF